MPMSSAPQVSAPPRQVRTAARTLRRARRMPTAAVTTAAPASQSPASWRRRKLCRAAGKRCASRIVTSTSSTGTRSAKGTPSASSWSFTCWVMGARLRVTAPFPSPSRRARWTAPCASRLAAFQPVRKVSVVVNERMALSTNSATVSWSGPVSSSRMTRSVTAAAMSAWMCSFEASGSIVPTYSSASPMSSRAHPERMASGTSSAVTTSSTPEATAEKPRPARRARDGAR
ncbi:hypothetical protein SF12_17615, partial [Streptomyces sp. MBRL 601]